MTQCSCKTKVGKRCTKDTKTGKYCTLHKSCSSQATQGSQVMQTKQAKEAKKRSAQLNKFLDQLVYDKDGNPIRQYPDGPVIIRPIEIKKKVTEAKKQVTEAKKQVTEAKKQVTEAKNQLKDAIKLVKKVSAKPKEARGCVDQSSLKKYMSRPSPAFPANECCGMVMTGNDGRTYKSVAASNGVCRWVKV